ncbi:MAG: ethylbenzene dehydrogenase-related protein [Saccharospirillaceae bacterium]|nr:ethylbenzene dehydrogenase-related protein [Saccharospirillaceae bacterium]MCD8531890.1 ethylbenzene dehydrogenase-related protein [Saccharospirillaceae bacterium]
MDAAELNAWTDIGTTPRMTALHTQGRLAALYSTYTQSNFRKSALMPMLHWVCLPSFVLLLISGLRLANDHQGGWYSGLAGLLPQGQVLLWHVIGAIPLLLVTVVYSLHIIKRRKLPMTKKGHAWLYLLLATSLFVLVVTGVGQWFALFPGEHWHRYAVWAMVAFVVLHPLLHTLQGGWRRWLVSFKLKRWSVFLLPLLAIAVVVTTVPKTQPLQVLNSPQEPILDGELDDLVWQQASIQSVLTRHGANFPNGTSRVWLQAASDGKYLYLAAKWEDPTRSQQHLPLVKTLRGWQVQQTAFLQADENQFYEDKFAVMLAPKDPLSAIKSVYLGPQPLADKPAPNNQRGFHISDGQLLDIWHWKSVRGQGQADDNHFTKAADTYLPIEQPSDGHPRAPQRYAAGYKKDRPMTWSGYELNWEYFSTDYTQPRRIPNEMQDIAAIQGGLNSAQHAGDWSIHWSATEPYIAEHDDMRIGTVLPGVIHKRPLSGDRGDVQAAGQWKDGYWQLELKRALNTGSAHDVAIENGTLIWVAAFNHSQTRHTYHLRPLKLLFQDAAE